MKMEFTETASWSYLCALAPEVMMCLASRLGVEVIDLIGHCSS